MLRRLLSLLLILSLLVVEIPAVLAEEMPAPEDAAYAEEAATGYGTLQRGDRDDDDSAAIVTLQTKLIALGYLRDAADGVYGKNTETAVASFQRVHELEETGIADDETQDLLLNGTDLINFVDSDDPESVSFRVEDKLHMWGFASNIPDGKLNSTSGDAIPDFKSYLRKYLQANPTPVPQATPAPTAEMMEAPIDMRIDSDAAQEITQDMLDFVDGKYEFDVYSRTVSNGDEGDEVWRVERRLYKLKYLAIVDGVFDEATERALLYFQKKNGLPQSAVADETTQRLLFSEAALESEEFVNAYKIIIDVSEQKVYVYQWNGGNYGICVGEMICSTGTRETPTPLGTFQASGPTGTGEWYWFAKYKCYAKWATRIVGGILFHSTTYSRGKVPNQTSRRKLGQRASHGCIRLKVEHAQWIYEHCVPGTTVIVQD